MLNTKFIQCVVNVMSPVVLSSDSEVSAVQISRDAVLKIQASHLKHEFSSFAQKCSSTAILNSALKNNYVAWSWTLNPRCTNWSPTNLCKFCRHSSFQYCKYSDKIREYSDTLHWHHKRGKKQCTRQRLRKQQQKRQTQYSNMCNMQLLTKSMK